MIEPQYYLKNLTAWNKASDLKFRLSSLSFEKPKIDENQEEEAEAVVQVE